MSFLHRFQKETERQTIEPIGGSYWFCIHGTYSSGSLKGQPFRTLVKQYADQEAAIAEHPEAEVLAQEDNPGPIQMGDWYEEDLP